MANIKITKPKDFVSEDGTYIIPVDWQVYATVRVKKNPNIHNLKEAIEHAKNMLDEIPLTDKAMYVDGSYRINIKSDEEAIAAQTYEMIGDVEI